MAKSEFDLFLQEEVQKQKGVAYPIKAGLFERLTTKELLCDKLHPNPQDEFTFPEIGPNYEIISNYEKQIVYNARTHQDIFEEPIMVEKLYPHGYLILNGHHRWAAAKRLKIKKIPVKIINLALESDIKKILENSRHDKRATFDMDEVVFRADDAPHLEKKLGFPFSIKHKRRIRLGIPALFYNLSKNGYGSIPPIMNPLMTSGIILGAMAYTWTVSSRAWLRIRRTQRVERPALRSS